MVLSLRQGCCVRHEIARLIAGEAQHTDGDASGLLGAAALEGEVDEAVAAVAGAWLSEFVGEICENGGHDRNLGRGGRSVIRTMPRDWGACFGRRPRPDYGRSPVVPVAAAESPGVSPSPSDPGRLPCAVVTAQARWKRIAAAAADGVGEMVRRRRSERSKRKAPPPPPPPVTTQSSPGQIADLELAYGAEMTPPPPSPPGERTADD